MRRNRVSFQGYNQDVIPALCVAHIPQFLIEEKCDFWNVEKPGSST